MSRFAPLPSSPRPQPTAAGATIALTSAAMSAFAANSLLCRAALAGAHVDPTSFTALRIASGALTLGILARWRGARVTPSSPSSPTPSSPTPSATPTSVPRSTSRSAWISALALFAYAIAFSLAYVRIPASVGALLLFGAVQLTMIGAGLRAGERPRIVEWTGLALSIAGLVVLTRPGLARPDPLGSSLMIGAGVAWGAYSLRGRRAAHTDAIATNAANFARAVPPALVAGIVAVALGSVHASTRGVVLAVASGAIASGLGYAAWYVALRGLTATRAAIVQLCVPPLAAVGSVLVLSEDMTPRLVVASVLVLGGIALAVLGPRRHAAEHANATISISSRLDRR